MINFISTESQRVQTNFHFYKMLSYCRETALQAAL